MKRDYDHLFKVLLIGDSAVVKSALVNRYVDEGFDPRFLSTIGVGELLSIEPRERTQPGEWTLRPMWMSQISR